MPDLDSIMIGTFGMIFGLSAIGVYAGYLHLSKAKEKGLPADLRQTSEKYRSVFRQTDIWLRRH